MTDDDKKMMKDSAQFWVNPAGVKNHLIKVAHSLGTKNAQIAWDKILSDYRATPADRFLTNPGQYTEQEIYHHPFNFSQYLNVLCS